LCLDLALIRLTGWSCDRGLEYMKTTHFLSEYWLSRRSLQLAITCVIGGALVLRAATPAAETKAAGGTTIKDGKPRETVAAAASESRSLFDGKTLQGWKKSDFAGSGEVEIKDGQIILGTGNDMTGITWTNDLPRNNYEVTLEAMRVDGSDFFCGFTFPVKQDPCSLIVGGWGGGVVGLSSIDGSDASENETTTFTSFKAGQWYRIKLRVTDPKIEAWIDDKKVVDLKLEGRRLSIRIEVESSKPFGFATWRTTGALRNLNLRTIDAATGSSK
jgi:hypothetical protein